MDGPSGFTHIVILYKNIQATCVIALSVEELGVIPKKNLRGIIMGIRPVGD